MGRERRRSRTPVLWASLVGIALFMLVTILSGWVKAENRTVRVGVYQNKPKIFLTDSGVADGFFIDLLEEIAKRENWTLVYVPCEWEACLTALETGEIDLMPDVAYSLERDEKYDFHHIPAAESWSRAYADPTSQVNRIDQLDGQRVAVLNGSIQQKALVQAMEEHGFSVTVVPAKSLEDAFGLVTQKSAVAVVTNHFYGDYFYRDYGLARTSIILNASTLYFATAEGQNQELLDAIDSHLSVWRDDPKSIYSTIMNRWLNPASVNRWLVSIIWVIVVILVLFCLAVVWVVILRRQVHERTRHLVKSNQALSESEERYRLISAVASDYIVSEKMDKEGRLSLDWVAGAFESITGYTFEEYKARGGWRASLHPDDLAADDLDREKLRANQPVHNEIRTITKSGETVWVQISAHPIWDAERNESVGITGAVQDITKRKQAEELIHQRTQDLELINAISSAINQDMEINDVLAFVSKELLEIFQCNTVVIALPGSDENYLQVDRIEFSSKLMKKIDKFIGKGVKSFQLRIPISGDGPFARICKQNEIEVINDPATIQAMMAEYVEEEWQKRLIPQAYKVAGVHSAIPVPLVASGRLFGLLQIGNSEPLPASSTKRIQVIADQLTAALARKHAERQTIQRLQNIEALHTIDNTVANSMDLPLTLKVVADETVRQMGVDAVDILLYNPASNLLETSVFHGFRTVAMQKVSLRIGQGLAGQIASNWERIFISDLADYRREGARASLFAGEDFVAYCGLPLWAKGQFIGVLEVFNRSRLNPDQSWFNFLETLAGQAAIAIDSINSFNEIQISNTKLIMAYDATIEGWSRAMDLRDKETEGHTQRVTDLTLQLARQMGIGDDQIVHIRRGALLHDMGKLGIPDQILLKPGKLSDDEWVIMRKHPVYAYDMLSSIEYLRPALDIPYCHHEKWDGSGYPRGLKGDEIPLAARIFAVIDVWDALTSDRPYRKTWSCEQALAYIREQTGTHFDPQVVKVFLANMDLS